MGHFHGDIHQKFQTKHLIPVSVSQPRYKRKSHRNHKELSLYKHISTAYNHQQLRLNPIIIAVNNYFSILEIQLAETHESKRKFDKKIGNCYRE